MITADEARIIAAENLCRVIQERNDKLDRALEAYSIPEEFFKQVKLAAENAKTSFRFSIAVDEYEVFIRAINKLGYRIDGLLMEVNNRRAFDITFAN